MPVSTPTALVAAAPTLFRQGLLAVLREQCPELAITLTADASQAEELATHHFYSLLVLEGALPGLLNLPRVLNRLRQARPSQRLLVLADARTLAHEAPLHADSDACLFVPSHVPPHALAAAISPWLAALPGNAAPAARMVPAYAITGRFSRREMEVLRLVVADCCNEEIANRLFINVRTVETHRRNLLQKAGTRTLVGLAARAVREGWVA
ncbi:response regulator transcription factor [Hymenobacter sp. 5317J-9]|uniref:response regulator transcription factor n=1 Tax=Hymenobacter sp. 5317J-9 TaxID=2932250 RepID=UPI001FD71A06|nr:response regulator transcription factor [Hymenobacter sp. 5317J-9]UOQ98025.1 response regulator transcription factor [Hymenobacter sp. 5317J-9]